MKRVSREIRQTAVITSSKTGAVRFAKAIGWRARNVMEVDAGIAGIGWMICELMLSGKYRIPTRVGEIVIGDYDREVASPEIYKEEQMPRNQVWGDKVAKAFLNKEWNKK